MIATDTLTIGVDAYAAFVPATTTVTRNRYFLKDERLRWDPPRKPSWFYRHIAPERPPAGEDTI